MVAPTWSGADSSFAKKKNPKRKRRARGPPFRTCFYADVYIFNANVFFLISEVI